MSRGGCSPRIEAADPARIGMMLGKKTRESALLKGEEKKKKKKERGWGIGDMGFGPQKWANRQLRFQLNSGREHPPRDMSSSETGHL
eukprot:gene20429-biopygen6723